MALFALAPNKDTRTFPRNHSYPQIACVQCD